MTNNYYIERICAHCNKEIRNFQTMRYHKNKPYHYSCLEYVKEQEEKNDASR